MIAIFICSSFFQDSCGSKLSVIWQLAFSFSSYITISSDLFLNPLKRDILISEVNYEASSLIFILILLLSASDPVLTFSKADD